MTPSYPHKHVVIEDWPMQWSPVAVAMMMQAAIWYTLGVITSPWVREWFGVVVEAVGAIAR